MSDDVNTNVPIPLNIDAALRVCLQRMARVSLLIDSEKASNTDLTESEGDSIAFSYFMSL